jgi:hypothetical protein
VLGTVGIGVLPIPGAAGVSAGVSEENRIGKEKRKEDKLQVRPRVRQTLGHPIIITITAPIIYIPSSVLGTVGIGVLPIPARPGYLPSAGTSLLDYKRGVPVAQPHGGQDNGRDGRTK